MSNDVLVARNGHTFPNLKTRVVGPTEPLTAPPPVEPVAADGELPPLPAPPGPSVQERPAPPALAEPTSVERTVVEASTENRAVAVVPQPVAATPRQREEVPNFEREMTREGYVRPLGPDEAGSTVSFPLRKAKGFGFGMSVLAAGTGQVLFFSHWFGGGVVGWVGAAFIAAFAEVAMIGAGDSGLRHKVDEGDEADSEGKGKGGWRWLLGVSGFIAASATAMQVAHWWGQSPVMALTFGIASITGWAVHIASGLIEANGYLRKKEAWKRELERRRLRYQQRQDAAYERELADEETVRQAAARAMRDAERRLAPPVALEPAARKQAPTTASRKLEKAMARRWVEENGNPGPKGVIEHFREAGYETPVPSTVRRWLNETK